MNMLVALLLVAGQLISGVHLASHVVPEAASEFAPESAYGAGFGGHSVHEHDGLEHAAHVHFHAHQAAKSALLRDKPPENAHNASDCTLCHLASHLMLAGYRGAALPQPSAAASVFVQVAEHSPAQACTCAHAIRGPPRLSA